MGKLCLNVKEGGSVKCGEGTITVNQAKNGLARLVFEFPPDVQIVRQDAHNKEPKQRDREDTDMRTTETEPKV